MTNTGAPTQPADTTCSENNMPPTASPQVTLQPAPVPSSILPALQDPAGSTTPPLDDYGKTEVPVSVTTAPQEEPTQGPEPPSYGEPSLGGFSPDRSSSPSPPDYSPAEQPTPSTDSVPDPYSPDQGYNEPPPTANCSSSFAPDVFPSETTLWPKASNTDDPQDQPPVPSQVPGSYTTRTHVPPFTTVGGLAFLAAMII
ncbi:hypothetical protein JDV02_000583 [Purpureocillium takamizusanense]|uniref:Uncharacterized protein n=1 Tax=Purpureocillium takamizusanense TaxID=2060973 RepID=A0A9Q8Q6X8_9HYPO|nr:uncharacterized protein JDV02_000583 [Purpureocillium takamizusanense]UNI13887.1 hypothetical protein JDV02_000583 [Purpureocillium takamizusanense]